MTPVATALVTFTAAVGVLTVTPGLDTTLVLRTAASEGARPAAGAAAGVVSGLFVWGACAALGFTALLAASPFAFEALKWAGAAWLVWMGAGLLLRRHAQAPLSQEPVARPGGALRRGFLSNILNPKVGLFYAAFLPQFIPPGVDKALFALALAGIHVALACLWFALLIALTAPLARWLARPAVAASLDRVAGCVFVGFGLKLALTER
jgi:threonine/homoserine/homoserine lactone efflux protein